MNSIIFIMEMIGTVAFAISGVLAAKEKRMDLFGAISLGCTTAVGGGMIRDLILGQTPPHRSGIFNQCLIFYCGEKEQAV